MQRSQAADAIRPKMPEAVSQLATIDATDATKLGKVSAVQHTLVTDNDKEFSRIEGLRVENWLRD